MTNEFDELIAQFRDHLKTRGFTLGRKLGRGAFGTVFMATQESLKRPVAVKLFTGGHLRVVADDLERFKREAKLLSKVEHPSLPYVVTVGTVKKAPEQPPYMVMQFISGGSLEDRIDKERRLPPEVGCELAVQLLGALEALHRESILHRDIKPNNILLSDGRAVLVDFSLGASLKYQPGLTRATKKGQGLGVPEYAAPEQLTDAQSCDGRADLYSVGVILFEMLVGHPRLDRNELEQQLGRADALAPVIQEACELDRNHRFGTASEFSDALSVFLAAGSKLNEEEGPGLCTNTKCSAASWSNKNYYFGPRFEDTPTAFCLGCGSKFLRRCPRCRAPLSPESRHRVTRTAKSESDAGSLYCAHCGHLIFEAPLCKSCGSLLKKEDMDADTAADGCLKCRHREQLNPFSDPPSDDDIPF